MVEMTTDLAPITSEQYYLIYRGPRIRLPSVEELIEVRIARLTSLGLARETDLRKLAAHITDRNFAFFPAWPDPPDFARWMAMVSYRDTSGVSYLAPGRVADLLMIPRGLCLGLDVDDGYHRRNQRPTESREAICDEGRVAFTVRMGVSYIGDHPYAIDGYGMDLVGSEVDSGFVPHLSIHKEKPTLGDDWYGRPRPAWGAPSCGVSSDSRIRKREAT